MSKTQNEISTYKEELLKQFESYHPKTNPHSEIDKKWLSKKRHLLVRCLKANDGFVSFKIGDELITFYAGTRFNYTTLLADSFSQLNYLPTKDKKGEILKRGIFLLKNSRNEVYFYLTKTEKGLESVNKTLRDQVKRAHDNLVKEGSSKYKKIMKTFKRLELSPGDLFPTGESNKESCTCDLCGTQLKESYTVAAKGRSLRLKLGSECVIQQTALGGNNKSTKDSLVTMKLSNPINIHRAMSYLDDGRKAQNLEKIRVLNNKLRSINNIRRKAERELLLSRETTLKAFLANNLILKDQREEHEKVRQNTINEFELKTNAKKLMEKIKEDERIKGVFKVSSIHPYKSGKGHVIKLRDELYRSFTVFLNNDNQYLSLDHFKKDQDIKGVFVVKGKEVNTFRGREEVKSLKGFLNISA